MRKLISVSPSPQLILVRYLSVAYEYRSAMETVMFDHIVAYYHHLADKCVFINHNRTIVGEALWYDHLNTAYNYIQIMKGSK